jgi:hypothetical protein
MDIQDKELVLVGHVFARCGATKRFLAIEVTNPFSAGSTLTFVSPHPGAQKTTCIVKRIEIDHQVANVAVGGNKCCVNTKTRKGALPEIGWNVFVEKDASERASQMEQTIRARPEKTHSQNPETKNKVYFA